MATVVRLTRQQAHALGAERPILHPESEDDHACGVMASGWGVQWVRSAQHPHSHGWPGMSAGCPAVLLAACHVCMLAPPLCLLSGSACLLSVWRTATQLLLLLVLHPVPMYLQRHVLSTVPGGQAGRLDAGRGVWPPACWQLPCCTYPCIRLCLIGVGNPSQVTCCCQRRISNLYVRNRGPAAAWQWAGVLQVGTAQMALKSA